ncbi:MULTISPECIES: hypothetical protein [Streptomyces]|uniref:Uncharacterized protein n=1 Tax=Streptomyces chartreusis NRRL 3882 TaxID=1079985 RepID=A0A2N9B038_STRCX|nr:MULTISPECIES: hypothetical protein [Streptomyces]SOR76695.1 hypothetical protein SCNRRL3882_0178 [Streptomyces chartreusis NRRL 3882]
MPPRPWPPAWPTAACPTRVIAPELYLENLLIPRVIGSVRERGVLPYPIRADVPVSWASHLDSADAVVALLDRTDVTGVVFVGQYQGERRR